MRPVAEGIGVDELFGGLCVGSVMTGGSSNQGGGVITSDLGGGGLKIAYEKQPGSHSNVELDRVAPTEQEAPTKRPR